MNFLSTKVRPNSEGDEDESKVGDDSEMGKWKTLFIVKSIG